MRLRTPTGAIAYRSKGENDRAIADYNEALRLDPKNAIAYANRGLAYRDKGDTDRAIADYTEAIRLDPKNARAYVNRGLAYEKLADFARARADYNTALGLSKRAQMGAGQGAGTTCRIAFAATSNGVVR